MGVVRMLVEGGLVLVERVDGVSVGRVHDGPDVVFYIELFVPPEPWLN